MNTRSQGSQHLHPFTDEIDLLQRQLREDRRRHLAEQMANNGDNPTHSPPGEGQNFHGPFPQGSAPAHPEHGGAHIGAGDAPRANTASHGLTPPPIHMNNFEFRGYTLNMVKELKFYGLQTEDPIKHIKDFDAICDLSKTNGVSEDAIKLRLFPFTLGDRARDWEQRIPPNTITTWAACKDAFLTKFFTNARTTRIRNQISGFTQNFNETLSQAWERFRGYIISCPHHDFKKSSLLGIFYKGALPNIQMFLDSSSGGSFLNKDVEFGWDLLENAAAADVTSGSDYDRTTRAVTTPDSDLEKRMKSLSERLDKLNSLDAKMDKLLLGQSKKPVNTVYDEAFVPEDEMDQFEEVSYMQNQGNFQQQGNYRPNQSHFNSYKPNSNLSYRSNNVANPDDQVYPTNPQQQQPRPFAPRPPYNNNFRQAPPGYQRPLPQPPQPYQASPPQATQPLQQPAPTPDFNAMFQQMIQGQNSLRTDINNKIDASHNDLNTKFEQLNARLTSVESNLASSSARPSGQLPGKAVQNPKEYTVKAITLRSGRELLIRAENNHVTKHSAIQVGGITSSQKRLKMILQFFQNSHVIQNQLQP